MIFSFIVLTVLAQPSCPDDLACMSQEKFRQVQTLLTQYSCLQNETPSIKVDPWVITIDKDGRIFHGPGIDAQTDIMGQIKWCPFTVDFKFKPTITMYTAVDRDYGFRLRFKAFMLGKILYYDTPREMIDVGVGLDFVYWRRFNFQVMLNVLSCGMGVGVDLTKNFGLVAGAVNPYWMWRPTPFLGFYFGF